MMSFESLFSYLFFILILSSLSTHAPQPESGAGTQTYSLLLDTIIVLEKSGLSWDLGNETSSGAILRTFNQITGQTGFCTTAESPASTLSNCVLPEKEKISQDALIISPAGIPQKIRFSIQKEHI